MRLLQVSLRTLLLYSLIMVIVSLPVSFLAIQKIIEEEVDESLALRSEQFLKHIKNFEYLDDIDMDLEIWDLLSYDISVKPSKKSSPERYYQTVSLCDSLEQEFHPFRILSSHVDIKNKHYLLTIRMSLLDNDELVTALAVVQAILIVLLVAGLLLLNRSLSRKLWMPFYDTLNQLKAYELDKNGSIQAVKTNIIEFDDLNNTVSYLTSRNRKVFLQQKEFIENASHELQTPLAIFQSKLDILMQNASLTESGAGTIQELEETVQRMTRLNKNLLLLSKIDNDQFTELEEVEISKIATTLLSNLRPLADLDKITIETFIDTVKIRANKTLVEVLLTNLFHNAIRHTMPSGMVSVRVTGRMITVTNTGYRLMNPEKIFERFSKESKSEKSTGLGLAIVKRICDTCDYTITYHFDGNVHSFSVTF